MYHRTSPLGPSDMDSDPVPTATSPHPADDAEVLSQEAPGQGETVLEAPQGDLLDYSTTAADGADEWLPRAKPLGKS